MAGMLRGALCHILKYINVHSGPEGRSRVTHGRADPLGEGGSEHLLFYVTDSSEQKDIFFEEGKQGKLIQRQERLPDIFPTI